MTDITLNSSCQRLGSCAGIAIGPILFIIAVLGILAAAIAAGSGSFTTGTTGESNRAKATAMVDMGQNLKIGFERILGNGVDFSSVDLDPTHTTAADDLFSPLGGGITSPSVSMAAAPATDTWKYPLIAIPAIGTTDGSRVAVLRVVEGVCDEVNSKVNSMATGAAHAATANIGDFGLGTLIDGSSWPGVLDGKMIGCVENTNATTIAAGFYFYQVLGVR